MDDTVKQSNKAGYITYAKTSQPNSRNTQLFINYKDNAFLDDQGFAPFGEVEGDGMKVVRDIYACGEKPDQGMIVKQGNAYLDSKFPELSKIRQAYIINASSSHNIVAPVVGASKYIKIEG